MSVFTHGQFRGKWVLFVFIIIISSDPERTQPVGHFPASHNVRHFPAFAVGNPICCQSIDLLVIIIYVCLGNRQLVPEVPMAAFSQCCSVEYHTGPPRYATHTVTLYRHSAFLSFCF